MPLSIPYTYSESDTHLRINVLAEAVTSGTVRLSNVDVFCAGAYIKVSVPPRAVLHLDLHDSVDESDLAVSLDGGVVVLSVPKTLPGQWPSLITPVSDKAVLKARRAAFEEAAVEAAAARDQARKTEKARLHRAAVAESVEEGRRKRERIAQRKKEEEDAAMAAVYAVEAQQAAQGHRVIPPSSTTPSAAAPSTAAPSAEDSSAESLPPVRKTAEIELSFSERVFPTPARESKAAVEDALLKTSSAAVADDADGEGEGAGASAKASIADTSAQWLKIQGDELLMGGDVAGAINAYNRAIEIDPLFPLLFSNRAICQLRLSRFEACVSDASQALALAKRSAPSAPPSPYALIRRGTALLREGNLIGATDDYVAASQLLTNPSLAADTAKLLYRLTRAYRDHALACLRVGAADEARSSLDAALARARSPQETCAIALAHGQSLTPAHPGLAAEFFALAKSTAASITPAPQATTNDSAVGAGGDAGPGGDATGEATTDPVPNPLDSDRPFLFPWTYVELDAVTAALEVGAGG